MDLGFVINLKRVNEDVITRRSDSEATSPRNVCTECRPVLHEYELEDVLQALSYIILSYHCLYYSMRHK